jgi:hypothetical protein
MQSQNSLHWNKCLGHNNYHVHARHPASPLSGLPICSIQTLDSWFRYQRGQCLFGTMSLDYLRIANRHDFGFSGLNLLWNDRGLKKSYICPRSSEIFIQTWNRKLWDIVFFLAAVPIKRNIFIPACSLVVSIQASFDVNRFACHHDTEWTYFIQFLASWKICWWIGSHEDWLIYLSVSAATFPRSVALTQRNTLLSSLWIYQIRTRKLWANKIIYTLIDSFSNIRGGQQRL